MKNIFTLTLLLMIALSQVSLAQSIIWSTFSMGYAESTGADTTLRSMVGQSFVGDSYIATTRISSGFLAGKVLSDILAVRERTEMPKVYQLMQNFPNPFNPSTTVEYQLPFESRVSLRVYNLLGQVVATLVDGVKLVGYQSELWHPNTSASGVYFYSLDATSVNNPSKHFSQTKKMILIK
jgi:hypothetical protein